MKVGARLYGLFPEPLGRVAQHAEKLGYESTWRGDHLVMPVRLSDHPGTLTATLGPDMPLLDNFVVFGYLAALTTTIRFGVAVYILPLRDPFVTARAVLTLDRLSGGRTTLGVGIGWLAEEFEAVGAETRGRGARTDEAINVLRALWTERRPSFEGRYYRVRDIGFEPKPLQHPHPPILVGGESDAALRRAARLGDGWYGHYQDPATLAEKLGRLRSLRQAGPRADTELEISLAVAPTIRPDQVRELESLGVHRIVVEFGNMNVENSDDIVGDVDRVARELINA